MSRLRDDIEQLTARLTTEASVPSQRPDVCVLLLGNLPVRAGLWRLPAVRKLLPDRDQIIVVRCDGDDLFLECIGEFSSSSDSTPDIFDSLPSGATLVVVPDANTLAEDIMAFDPDSIGLVTGGDQAAAAGAYRMLKGMKLSDGQDIDLVIAGSEGSSVEESAARLHEPLQNHLGLKLKLRGDIARIEAATGLTQSTVMKVPEGGLAAVVRRVRRGISQPPRQQASTRRIVSAGETTAEMTTAEMATAPLPASLPLVTEHELPAEHESEPCVRLSPAPPSPQWSSLESQEAKSVVNCHFEQHDVPVEEHRVQETAVCDEQDLCGHLPGLRLLPIQCPDHEVVELAVDELGGIHLVARCEDVLHLPSVLSWIERHHALLRMALSDTLCDPESKPAIHVVGEDIDALCGLRDSAWQPHLLVRVNAGGPPGWTSVPLGKS